jgi:glutaminase
MLHRNAVSKAAVAQTVQILNMTDKWAQNLHLAAKSSISGAIFGARTPLPPQTVGVLTLLTCWEIPCCVVVVVPGVLGLAVYSPRLSPQMKSVAGTKFCEALATAFPSLVQASH